MSTIYKIHGSLRSSLRGLILTTAITTLLAMPAGAGFVTRMVVLDPGGADSEITTATEALDILDGNFAPGAYTFSEDVTSSASVINMGPGGDFGGDTPYPNGETTIVLEGFTVSATAALVIPTGTWTIGFGSDDGGLLSLAGITFSNEINTDGDFALDDTILHDGPRGFGWTMGVFTVGSDTNTTLDALFFEYYGGDAFEIAIAQGSVTSFNTTDFAVLSDGQFGWVVTPEPSSGLLLLLGMTVLPAIRRRAARLR